jgi:anti-sigma regulatory factor (Ser/Thr protein kinase)
MLEAKGEFSADRRNVAAARRFVTATLASWEAAAFDWVAVIAVSELTTNAVLHARTSFTVSLRLDEDLLRIAVTDRSVLPPQQRSHGPEATSGRGMNLLNDLSAAQGVEWTAVGKTVWCQLRADDDDSADAGPSQRHDTTAEVALLAASQDAATV